jgi:serine/threonine-protein kinase
MRRPHSKEQAYHPVSAPARLRKLILGSAVLSLLIAVVGVATYVSLKRALHELYGNTLLALVDAQAAALNVWHTGAGTLAGQLDRQPSDARLAAILRAGRQGETGESYLFDRAGTLHSESRFAAEARFAGLGPPLPLRDPGGDVVAGHRPEDPPEARSVTRLVGHAIAARSKPPEEQRGVLLEPYRNYLGRHVIGAWRWLPQHDVGIAVELAADEAFRPLRHLWYAFGSLLLAAAATIAWLSGAARLRSGSGAQAAQRQVGAYLLTRQIGEGAMAHVYLARHMSLQREAAVKLLKLQAQTDEALERFQREAHFASQLRHPNTIHIFDFGRAEDGALFFAMEYVDGMTLTEMVTQHGPVHPARVVRFLSQISAALAEAHDRGIFHRDIKPENIMACVWGGEYDFIKVLDFGLVKGAADNHSRNLTQYAKVLGTPAYMAPERLQDPRRVDGRTDLYGVGGVGFYLLTGRRPFEAGEDSDLVQQVLHIPAPRVSAFSPHRIPPTLDELLLSCLEKDPDRRPRSAAELRSQLDAIALELPWRREEAKWWWGSRHASVHP